MQNKRTIRLQGDSLFERFVTRAILTDSEVLIQVLNGPSAKGFVTGIDGHWLQVTDGEKTEQKMIRVGAIVSFSKTGQRISNLPKGSKEKLTSMTHTLRKRCQDVLAIQGAK